MNEPASVKPPLRRRARAYARTHGLSALLRLAFRHYVFSRSPYYLYVCPHTLTARDVPEPSVEGFHAVMVTSNVQADELARTHEDLRETDRNARRGLDGGAIACCLYSGSNLACTSWLAATGPALRAIDSIGFTLDPAEAVAWTGRVQTRPQYRRKGMFRYVCALRFDYLRALGIQKSSTTVAPRTTASHVMSAQLGCQLAGKGEVIRLLGHQWWRPLRLTQADRNGIRAMVAAALARQADSCQPSEGPPSGPS